MPDTSTVRSLITNVTDLARHLDVTTNAVYRWIKVNRLPGRHILHVAKFYDIEVPLHLAQSDKKNGNKLNFKPRETLPVCLEVQAGKLTVDEAAAKLGLHKRAVQLILTNWGDQLQLLYRTLVELDAKTISLDQAAATLQVSKFNIHSLRKKYGFKPAPRAKPEAKPIVKRRETAQAVALDVIAGKYPLDQSEQHCDLSWRTIHRTIAKLSPEYGVIELTHWPKAFRQALSVEITKDLPRISQNLWKYTQIAGISLKKWPKYPEVPTEWRLATAKKMMIHVLLGDETVESIAEKRGADPTILESIFTSDLRPLNMTWKQVKGLPVETQAALAEVLLAIEEGKKTPRLKRIEQLAEEKK